MHWYRHHDWAKRCGLRRGIILGLLSCLLLPLGTTEAAPDGGLLRDMGVPVRLKIPVINVDAPIEDVGLTPDGAMDTPKDFGDTAWYQLGPRPGEQGNAVIAGHVDRVGGEAVFWDLRQLTPGDEIIVMSENGIAHHFAVTGLQRYALDTAPLTEIFGSTDGIHLNLVTCDADTPFNRASGEYGGHLLIRADAIP